MSNEDTPVNNKPSSVRMNMFFFAAFVIFSILIFRLAFVQFVEGPELTYMETSRNTKDIPLAPVRGPIYDATGEVALAYSEPVQSLYVLLYEDYRNDDRKQEAQELADELAAVFKQFNPGDKEQPDAEEIMKRLDLESQKAHGYTPRLVKSDLNMKEIAYFMEKKAEYPGAMVLEENVRKYDPDRVAVQVIGYTREFKGQQDNLDKYREISKSEATERDPGLRYTQQEKVGVDGLEFQYQEELRGRSGYQSIDINLRNLPEGTMQQTPPEKGYSLVSTINKEIQMAAQQAITDELRKLPKAVTGYAVAMEVDTGNVVAMASMPDYDPNDWDYDKIKYVYRNGTMASFPPDDSKKHTESVVLLGSVIKPLSVLIGLKEGLFTTGQTYPDQGYAILGKDGRKVRNSHSAYNGNITARRAIEKSSNAFMIDMVGKRLLNKYGSDKGLDVWHEHMQEFGLGVSTGVDLPGEFLGRLEYKNKDESALTRLAFASFGQQGKYTTLQLAQYTTMLANKGKRMEPHLVKEIRDADGNVVKKIKPKVLNEVDFADVYWNEVHKGMVTRVSSFEGFPYDYARKTGTSEQGTGPNKKENGVFIAFAPRDNPKLAIAVVVPEGGFGSVSASPIARKIFDAYDQVYGLDGTPKGKKDQGKDTE
ncbi:penicillin-binding transpeptidase domain-containing protein [Paenibacillus taichungensis]|nr:penicillin-binding transpeptidase domain-containing protein [Paenibacillus taichungensis]MEC0105403.1 penicillin-binding transpeptidase domain-containing protein [Paenibacillus taichungensis]MEC0200479.1 penicillin-binding transpeptidase domain-containing protein [Paenibacillus taichungensis]OME79333.1 cell division protein FtsI [Paenibacillus pabuli]